MTMDLVEFQLYEMGWDTRQIAVIMGKTQQQVEDLLMEKGPRWKDRWGWFVGKMKMRIRGMRGRWEWFLNKMKARLQAGFIEYGDGSFERCPLSLLNEVEEEILDQIGWSYIQLVRIQKTREKLQHLTAQVGSVERFLEIAQGESDRGDRPAGDSAS